MKEVMYNITVAQQLSIFRQQKGEIVENMNTAAKGKAPETSNDGLLIEPLTSAKLEEPVVCTPKKIMLHPAYNGGWKVLRRFRPDGRADLTYKHKIHGRFRSKKQVLNHLNYLLEKEKKSADPAKQASGSEEEAPPEKYVVLEEKSPQESQHGEGGQASEQPPVCLNHGPSNFA